MSIMNLAKKAVSVAARSKTRGPVRHRTTSPKAAAARTAVREVSKAVRK